MTELQLKIMERADKTLSFGCLLENEYSDDLLYWYTYLWEWHSQREQMMFNRDNKSYDYDLKMKIIWRPYWFERLIYLALNHSIDNPNEQYIAVDNYICSNTSLLLKPCIDRPEEWQQLVIEFLETLPKSDS